MWPQTAASTACFWSAAPVSVSLPVTHGNRGRTEEAWSCSPGIVHLPHSLPLAGGVCWICFLTHGARVAAAVPWGLLSQVGGCLAACSGSRVVFPGPGTWDISVRVTGQHGGEMWTFQVPFLTCSSKLSCLLCWQSSCWSLVVCPQKVSFCVPVCNLVRAPTLPNSRRVDFLHSVLKISVLRCKALSWELSNLVWLCLSA